MRKHNQVFEHNVYCSIFQVVITSIGNNNFRSESCGDGTGWVVDCFIEMYCSGFFSNMVFVQKFDESVPHLI